MKKTLFIVMAALTVAACVDKSYDPSKGFDTSMSVDANLGIPLGSTEFISIGDILKVDGESEAGDWGIVLNGDGYYIQIPGGNIRQEIDIPFVEFPANTSEETEAGLFLSGTVLESFIGSGVPAGTPEKIPVNFSDGAGHNPKFEMKIDSEALPSQISGVQYVELANSIITVNFLLDNGRIELKDNLSLTFPTCFKLEAVDADVLKVEDSVVTLRRPQELVANTPWSLGLKVTRIDFPAGCIQGGKLVLNQEIELSGGANIYTNSFSTVPDHIKVTMSISTSASSVSKASVNLNVNEHFDGEAITVGNMPEELQNVSLNLWNPMIKLAVSNGTSFSAGIDANIVTSKNNTETHKIHIGSTNPGGQTTDPVILAPNAESTYLISRQGNAESGETPIKIEDLGDLFNPIPDEIVINDIYVRTDSSTPLEIEFPTDSNSKYVVELSYSLNAPLAFGDGLSINYPVKIDGLGKLFNTSDGGAVNFDLRTMEISFTIKNKFPLNIAMDVKALDTEGHEIAEGVSIDAALSIPANTDSPLKITITGGDALSLVDALQLDLTITNNSELAGVVFNKEHGLQILDIKGRVSATINADFFNKDNE